MAWHSARAWYPTWRRAHEGYEAWVRAHRAPLYLAWAAVGVIVVAALALGPDFHYIRATAPLPRIWAILFFLSLWCWVALRFISLWIWAWVVMALAPVCLAYPIWYNLEARWLMPLLYSIVGISLLTVVGVVWWELRRRRLAAAAG